MTGYTTREVAEILGLSVHQVRSYARSGLVAPGRGPHREYRFSFQDVVILRAAAELIRSRVPTRRVNRALRRLRAQLPRGRSLAGVQISSDGDQVSVRDRDTVWDPDSEQTLLDFSVADLASRAAPFARRVVEEGSRSEPLDPDAWFDLGHDLEAVSVVEASKAYGQALRLDPRHPAAHLNLGRLLHEEGDLTAAERHYREAVAGAPVAPLAWYNLGVVLEDLGRRRDAVEAYRHAVRIDPALAAAHHNLARIHEELGETTDAIRHFSEYRRLQKG